MFSPVEFAGTATQTAPQTNPGAAEKFARQIDVTAMTQERSRRFVDAIGEDSIETHVSCVVRNPFVLGELHAVIDIGHARNKA
jgi:hypothetical protein